MTSSPFAVSTSRAGQGSIHLTLLPPATPSFRALNYTYPLKLVCSTPHRLQASPTGNNSKDDLPSHIQRPANVPLIFMLSYGGGLLPPDSINLSITLDAGTRLTLTTQGSTKVFPSSSATIPSGASSSSPTPAVARQTLTAYIDQNAALLLAPDPVQPFARSHYAQTQIFHLASTASLCLLDWVIEGRRARGESWLAGSWRGRNEIWRDYPLVNPSEVDSVSSSENILMLRDTMILDSGPTGPGQSSLKREGMGAFGTIILAGPIFQQLGMFFVDEFRVLPRIGGRRWGDEDDGLDGLSDAERALRIWRMARIAIEANDGVLWTAAQVRGTVVVKFSARELEGAKRWIDSMWRWEGTVMQEFGEGGMMCLR